MPRMLRQVLSFAFMLGVLALGSLLSARSAPADPPTPPYLPGEVILKFKSTATQNDMNQVYAELGGTKVKGLGRIKAELRRLGTMSVEDAVTRYRNHPKIEYMEPNYIVEAEEIPNDPMFTQLYGLQNTGQTGGTAGADIHATQAWDVFTGSSSALIGIIDTGIDYNHPDLAANVWTNPGEIPGNSVDDDNNGYVDDVHGYDFINNDGDPFDDNGHGSHVAGTIGAVGDNGVGVVGVNWTVKMMGLKFLSSGGSGSTADAIEAVTYATMMGVRLTSNSWGGGGFSQGLLDAINAANTAGILFVAAAGNSGANTDTSPHYPSAYASPNIISVAATDHNDNLASFSNYGATTVDLAAPGVNILSTFPGNQYGSISGTSMATPHVSGALGLIFGRFPGIGHASAKNLILTFVDPKASLAGKCVTGGRLNAFLPIADPDSIPPGTIDDLAVGAAGSNWLVLNWQATGDDGETGTASAYVVKVSTAPITEATFDAAITVPNSLDPGTPGAAESLNVPGLDFSTTYYFAVKARDEFGNTGAISNPAYGTTLGAPDIAVAPPSLTETLLTGGSSTQLLTLSNVAEGTLDFTLPVPELLTNPTQPQIYVDLGKDESDPRVGPPVTQGFGGPDGFGYRWVDSDEPTGPIFDWTDISPIGTVALTSGDDSNGGPFQIGFPFSYYGVEYTQFRVCSNGWLSFTSTSTAYNNQALPNTGAPANMIAPFWDDLTLTSTGDVYYHNDGNRLIVQWNAVPHYSAGGPYTFQAVLYPDGTIEYNYLSMTSPNNSASVGLQNATGTDGLQVAFNTGYVHDNLTVRIFAVPQWLTAEPTSGTVYAGGNTTLNAHFQTEGLLGGTYEANVRILSNDPDEPNFIVPVTLTVIGAPDVNLVPQSYDFGPVFIGASPTTIISVQNPGTDVLTVSGVSLDNPAYTVDMTSFTVPPRSARNVTVTFQPSAVAPYPATLTVLCDDPDEPSVTATLSGSGVVPPDFAVTPASLDADLFTGETEMQALHLSNTGGATLEWDIDLEYLASSQVYTLTTPMAPEAEADGGQPGEDSRTTPIQAELADLTGIDILWDRSHGQSTTSLWSTIIADFTSRGATLTSTGTSDVITPALLANYDVIWISDLSGTWDPPEVSALVNWMAGGGSMLLEGDNTATVPIYNQLLTALGAGIVVSLTDGSAGVSTNIHPHPTTENVTGVYFTANTASIASIASPGGPLVDDDLGVPAVAYSQIGAGRVIVAADEIFQNARMSQANNQLFGNQVMDWLAGSAFLTVSPRSGTVPPGGASDVSVVFNAVGVFGGAYDANIHINTNDPLASLVTVPASLQVTGAPDLTLDPASLDFGEVFTGYADLHDYTVTNTGTDNLIITAITSDHPAFTPDFSGGVTLPLQLDPLHATVLRVRFAPTAPGYQAASITLASNDPDTPNSVLAVSGTGRMPPAGSVSPLSLHEDLLTGETATDQVFLTNTGNSDLEWTTHLNFQVSSQIYTLAAPEPPTGPDEDGGAVGEGTRTTPIQVELSDLTGVDILWDRSHGQSANTSWTTIVSDFTSRGATFTQTTTSAVITPALLLGYDVLWSSDTNQLWDPAELGALVNWVKAGGGLLLEGDNAASVPVYNQLLSALGAGITFATTSGADGTSTNIYPHQTTQDVTGIYFSANVASIPGVAYPGGRLVDDVDGVPAAVFSQSGAGRIIAISDEVFQNSRMSQASNQLFGNQVMDWLSVPAFLSVTPVSGAVPPGQSAPVEVKFDATGLFGGDYAGQVQFLTNDPLNGVLSVAATLHVTGVPRIAFSDPSVDFGNVFIGYPSVRQLTVQNVGTDHLSVSGISAGLPDYTVNPATLELAPLQSAVVNISFGPVAAGDRSTQLSFASNDPDSPHLVSVTGVGVVPPVIGTSPATVVGAAPPGGSKTKTLTVCNTGGSDLTFAVSASEVSATATQVHQEVVQPKGTDVPGGDEPVDPRPGILGAGGPDMYGYRWVDSDDAGGPAFDWVDISAIGTPTDFPPYDLDGNFGPYPIGFDFPFYGNSFSEFHVCENGWISFTNGTLESYSNQALPNSGSGVPENMLAIIWDDMVYDESDGSYIVYHNDGTRLIIEYFVRRIAQSSPPYYNFEIILYPNGNIVYQYRILGPTRNSATIGIQNGTKTDGLNVVFNQAYVKENFSILFSSRPAWLSVNPTSGVVAPGACLDLSVAMDAAELEAGDYFGRLNVTSNDPANPSVSNDVVFHVGTIAAAHTDVEPNTINLDNRGMYVTAYLELPPGYDPADVLLSTVTLNGTVPADAEKSQMGDFNENGIPDWAFKFPRAAVEAVLPVGDPVTVTITGEVEDTIWFTGSDDIRVIRPSVLHPNGSEVLVAWRQATISWTNPAGWNVDHATVLYSPDLGATWSIVAENVQGTSYDWRVPENLTTTGLIRVYLHDNRGIMGYDTSDGPFSIAAQTGVAEAIPAVHRLYQNVPNPFSSSTQVPFDLPQEAKVNLKVYDLSGRVVRTVVDDWFPAGKHVASWDGRDSEGKSLAAGIYFYRIEAGKYVSTLRTTITPR